jgi:hypothetical protein
MVVNSTRLPAMAGDAAERPVSLRRQTTRPVCASSANALRLFVPMKMRPSWMTGGNSSRDPRSRFHRRR